MIAALQFFEDDPTQAAHPAAIVSDEARSTATDISVLCCAGLLLFLCLGESHFDTKKGIGKHSRMAVLIAIWFWTTTTWAAEAKSIIATFTSNGNEPGFPLLGYWLTFAPQAMSSVLCISVLCYRRGLPATKELLLPPASWSSFWLLAGAGYWYGQFFTVQSLVFGNPALTFIVKAAEPLSTALLAVLILKRPFSMPLLMGIGVACLGIAVTVLSAGSSAHGGGVHAGQWQMAGMLFALLANLGFSSRACVAKKAISHMSMDPFETYSMMTIVGAQVGMLPLITYFFTNTPTASASSGIPFTDFRFQAFSWFTMCLSYMLYQTCSVLILSVIAVESHALLVAMKHMMVVVLVSILVHAQLNIGIVVGMVLTLLGVYLYLRSSKDEGTSDEEQRAIDIEERAIQDKEALTFQRLALPVSKWEAPAALKSIVTATVLLGCMTPSLVAHFGITT